MTFLTGIYFELTGRVARLKSKGIKEEVEPNIVASSASLIGTSCCGPAVLANEGSVDVVEDVCPDLTNG